MASFLNRNCVKQTTDANFPNWDLGSISLSFFLVFFWICEDKISLKTSLLIASPVEVFVRMKASNEEMYSHQEIYFSSC